MTDLEVTTHVRCPEDALTAVLQRYVRMLHSIGCSDSNLAMQLAHVGWEPDGSGFGYLGEFLECASITVRGQPFKARPYILGYTDVAAEGLRIPWVQLSLVFEGDMVASLMDNTSGKLRVEAGSAIWQIAQGFSKVFHESGVYFNDSPTVNEPWYALTGRKGNLWAFDLALIPEELVQIFWPIPDGYVYTLLAETVGLARLTSWEVIPWMEAHG